MLEYTTVHAFATARFETVWDGFQMTNVECHVRETLDPTVVVERRGCPFMMVGFNCSAILLIFNVDITII